MGDESAVTHTPLPCAPLRVAHQTLFARLRLFGPLGQGRRIHLLHVNYVCLVCVCVGHSFSINLSLNRYIL